MIGVINARSGNIGSLANALRFQNIDFKIVEKKTDIENFKKIILPGVGAFKKLKQNLIDLKLYDYIKNFINEEDHSFLGICVGMQILLSQGTEEGTHDGLNFFEGEVVNFNKLKKTKIPNISWLNLNIKKKEKLLNECDKKDFYFLHSYFCNVTNKDNIISTSIYNGIEFPVVIKNKNIYGVQFHPEKSKDQGLRLLKNFSNL